jgi:hypothetical protein
MRRSGGWLMVAGAMMLMAFGAGAGEAAKAGRPAFETETWPATRKLVWADPGKGGAMNMPKNWTEGGKPAVKPPDKDTDLDLPDSDTPYVVAPASSGRPLAACRHLTIGRNAAMVGPDRSGTFEVWGNLWVKTGGMVHYVNIAGTKNTFARMDGAEYPVEGDQAIYRFTDRIKDRNNPWAFHSRTHIHHKMMVTKFEGGSVEFLGKMGIGDELYVCRGKMIIGPDAEFRYNGVTGKGTFEVFDGATLELQSGATLATYFNESAHNVFQVSVYKGGTIQAGSPERPIAKDAYLLLGFGRKATGSGAAGLYSAEGSKIRVYSSDPAKARLVLSSITSRADFRDGKGKLIGKPEEAASGDKAGIEMHLAGDVDLDGVLFDYVRAGGIRMKDVQARANWSPVVYGGHNAAAGDALYAPLAIKGDTYYHERRENRFFEVMNTLTDMQKETGSKFDIIYPTSGKILSTDTGKVRYAPGYKKE